MATPVLMPRQGQTVENCIIAHWRKQPGDVVRRGEILCEVETDKALMEVESPAEGTLLAHFFAEGVEVPVLETIAVIGQRGEDIANFFPLRSTAASMESTNAAPRVSTAVPQFREIGHFPSAPPSGNGREKTVKISPRARNLAALRGVNISALNGTGPGGRIVERDIHAALSAKPRFTPLAQAMVSSGDYVAPEQGTGIGGRITTKDLQATLTSEVIPSAPPVESARDEVKILPLQGVRKVIAARMLASMQNTAQFTLNLAADARVLLAYRKRLKSSPAELGLHTATLNDLLMYAAAHTAANFPDINSTFENDTIYHHRRVHLGFAVDTPRGLLVPVIRSADSLTLKELTQEAGRLVLACVKGKISPDELSGGTFTVSNLGSFGIESFTPILNLPQAAILGIGTVYLKPVSIDGDWNSSGVQFIPHINLSLTVNHQVIDGAQAARFLQALAFNLVNFELLLAV
jgi:pyruvate dehydrogenase E2 component (dihydrolipoamide acetyltransferase)